MIENESVLITGGLGFIGTNLLERLLDRNKVTVYDSGHRNALVFSSWTDHPNLRVIKGDILDLEALKEAVEGRSMVLHMAAIAGVDTVVNNPFSTFQVNVIGTYNLIKAIGSRPLKRFVVFSTSEIYGPQVFQADEDDMSTMGPNSQPRWQYAISKLSSEFMSLAYYREHGLPTTIIRPFNVYGPYQVGEGAIRNFVFRALRREPLVVHGQGNEIRSWCYVDDFVDGLAACLENDQAVGQTFNLGNPQATYTNLSVAEMVIRLTGSPSEIQFKEIEYPEIALRVPSIKKAGRILGYKPRVNLEEGLTRLIKWCRDHEKVLDIYG